MDIRLQMQSALQWSIIEKFNAVALNIKAAADFPNFIQKSHHIMVLRPFNKNAPSGTYRRHPPRSGFDPVRNDCMLDFIKTARPLYADGPINIHRDDRPKLLQK